MADLGGFLSSAGIGSAIGKAVVQLELDTAKYQTELAAAEGKTSASASTMSSGLTKSAGLSQTALLAVGAAAVKFGADSVKAAMEAEKAMAQTEAVLKSTGGAAGVTADDVLSLAGSLRDLTGVDDEAIQSSENLLLTFRDVRNEVGKGNDIFNQAEGAVLDMATALNQGAIPSAEDLKSSTIQLGKALNDPIQGLTALRRVGVSFSESQVETIKKLQESGDLMGAQKIILGELSKEFGGAAKAAGDTFAGQLAKLQSKLGDLEESVGRILIPALEELADTAMDILQPLADLLDQIDRVRGSSEDTGFSIGGLYRGLVELANPIEAVIHPIGRWQQAWDSATGAVEEATASLASNRGVVGDISDFYRDKYVDAIDKAGKKTAHFAHMTVAELDKWSKEVGESIDSYIFDLDNLSGQAEQTRREFVRAHEAMLDRARETAKALREIAREDWVNPRYIEFLADQGPGALVNFADLNERQQHRMQEAWKETAGLTDNAKTSIDKITGALDALDNGHTKHEVEIHYTYSGFDPSKPGMGAQP